MQTLSFKAKTRGVSLKKYIENLLESDAQKSESREDLSRITSSAIRGLIGIGHFDGRIEDLEDDRLQYILSK
jgi:hypothetical protein